jgi:hypothetical protein
VHKVTGSAPANRSALTASMSRFEPGNTTTPIRTLIRAAPAGRADDARAERLDVERLDQRVRQQLAGEPLDDRPRRRLVRAVTVSSTAGRPARR